MSGLYCFCPELLLEGDEKHVFDLFNRLARRLERCGAISDVEGKSAVEEFRTFVVDVRGRHAAGDEVAENIPMSSLICWEITHFWLAKTCAECLNCAV